MIHTDDQLIKIAQSNPKELIRILTNHNTDPRVLVAGAEILGLEVKDESIVLPTLRALLKHMNAMIREAACIGIKSFYEDQAIPIDILDKLKTMSKNDPSPIVRDYIRTIL